MRTAKSPGAVAALGASLADQLGRQVISENKRQQQFAQPPIRAELIGSGRCEAEGIRVYGYAPVLDLCRELLAAGFNPASQLEAWRRETLCLRVRSIGEAARLTVADNRHGHHAFDAGRSARKGVWQAGLSRKTQAGGCQWLPQCSRPCGRPRNDGGLGWRGPAAHGARSRRASATAASPAAHRPRTARLLRPGCVG